ncbi:MAG: glycine betaine ABC transporter substrate-binding protein [Mycobacteriales bacterium]
MNKRIHRAVTAGLAVVALVGVAACGSKSGGGSTGGSIGSNKSFSMKGATFKVGAKEFTESRILGYITADALTAAGAKTTNSNLTGSSTVRTSLTSGRLDMYWEYDGTAWLTYLKEPSPIKSGEPAQYAATAKGDLAKNQVKWLTASGVNDSYGVAMRGDATGDLGKITTLSEMAAYMNAHPGDATFCGAAEFLNRNDGFPNIEKSYGFKITPAHLATVDLALDYTQVAKGKPCNFAEIFTTDGRIQTLKLKVLKDDKNAFGTYVAGLTVRNSVYTKYSKQFDGIFAAISPKLTSDVMIGLNKQVDVDGKKPEDVAKSWLKSEGFIS